MASYSRFETFDIKYNRAFLEKAKGLKPDLIKEIKLPTGLLSVSKNDADQVETHNAGSIENLKDIHMNRDDKVCLDFGDHMVGYVTLKVAKVGSHQDAPAYLRLKFAEVAEEVLDKIEDYDGWISKGWIQEEFIHIDVLPATIKLPRRYAFRYLEILTIDASQKFSVVIEDVSVEKISAVSMDMVPSISTGEALLDEIDRVSLRTLQDCMQDVFEDGPKRDRRMWMGDFRLQALVSYGTFDHFDLVKRSLYLFFGMPFNEDRISACIFTEPTPEPDDTFLIDYALFTAPTLYEYVIASGDHDTLKDLYPLAMKQLTNAISELNDQYILEDKGDGFWCFIDWSKGLNKQAGAQAILIYCMRFGLKLAELLNDSVMADTMQIWIDRCIQGAMNHFWDEDAQMFVSGDEDQISWGSQIWMILAGVMSQEANKDLIHRTIEKNPSIGMVTPYMHHYYVDALIECDEMALAFDVIKEYWGGMIKEGADTFWELYNPKDRSESPYGSNIVNSYCHAWSCTPAYFIRKYK